MAENFYPENRFPKKGFPVLNSNGDQRNLTDPRYRYQDGVENTSAPPYSSTGELFYTPEAAASRANDLGCNGYHIATASDGVSYYAPCGDNIIDATGEEWLASRLQEIEAGFNFTYIGNYRILSWNEPFTGVSQFNGWIIDAVITNEGPMDPSTQEDILIDFRYSVDGSSWSLWSNLGSVFKGATGTYNTNDRSWSSIIPLDPQKPFYPEFRFTSVAVNSDGSIAYTSDTIIDPKVVVVAFELDLTYADLSEDVIIKKPALLCSAEKSDKPVVFEDCGPLTFNPYAVNQALNVYEDLSKTVNQMFGWEVNYYSVQPQGRSKDVVLKEYTLYNVVDEKCVKVVVPNNQFPENRPNYDPFGIQFEEPFEVHIDKKYFESIFGRGSQPRKRDIIYFPLTNRIYEINSMYLFRDFMYKPVYFKVELKKYTPKSNTFFSDPALKEELDGIILNEEKLFGADIRAEEEKLTKPQQYANSTQRRQEDPTRSYVYEDLPIIGFDLNNNWTIVFNNYYGLDTAFEKNSDFEYEPDKYRNGVRYKNLPHLGQDSSVSYTSWFTIKNYFADESFTKKAYPAIPVSVESLSGGKITYSTHPYKHGLTQFSDYADNPNGYVSILADDKFTGGFRVDEVIDDYRFALTTEEDVLPLIRNGWKCQKAQSRNLLDGLYLDPSTGTTKGMRIDLIHSGVNEPGLTAYIGTGSFEFRINDLIVNSPLQFKAEDMEWYGVVVNVSNKYRQLGLNVWKLSYDNTNPQEQSTDLIKIHEDIRTFTTDYIFSAPPAINKDLSSPFYDTDDNAYKIWTGPIRMSNIRLFKEMIDIEKQSIILNQNVVRDAQLAHIIDNASPILKVRKFANRK